MEKTVREFQLLIFRKFLGFLQTCGDPSKLLGTEEEISSV
jgi:hypothetical protein